MTVNVAKLTQAYISEHPSVKDVLRRGLINYSALAREICDASGIESFDAVLAACRRYYDRIKTQVSHERAVVSLIKKARLRVRNKIVVAIVEKGRDLERVYLLQKDVKIGKGDFNLIEGENAVTIITNLEHLPVIKEIFKGKIKKVAQDLVLISLMFDERIETTSGVVSYIYGLLAENSINVLEELSCWTDLMIVIKESDLAKAMKVLSL